MCPYVAVRIKLVLGMTTFQAMKCLLLSVLLCLDVAAGAPSQTNAERLVALRDGDDAAATCALSALTVTSDAALENLGALLNVAREATDPMDSAYLRKDWTPVFWDVHYRTRGALILARAADVIRELDEGAARHEAMERMRAYALEGLAGRLAAITPREALESYYYCIFYPRGINVAPDWSQDAQALLDTIQQVIKQGDDDLSDVAFELLLRSAYILRDRRTELVAFLESLPPPVERGMCQPWIDGTVDLCGEAVSKNVLVSIRQETEQELVEDYLGSYGTDTRSQLISVTLEGRLSDSPNREAIIVKALNRAIHQHVKVQRYIAVPPIPEDAPDADKHVTDHIIRICEENLFSDDTGIERWLILKTLQRMIYTDKNRVEMPGAGVRIFEFRPYARDRVVDLLLRALNHGDRQVQEEALSYLSDVAWLGKEPAEKVLQGFRALEARIEQTCDTSQWNNLDPSRLPNEKSDSERLLDEVKNSLRKVEATLAAFSTQNDVPIMCVPFRPRCDGDN